MLWSFFARPVHTPQLRRAIALAYDVPVSSVQVAYDAMKLRPGFRIGVVATFRGGDFPISIQVGDTLFPEHVGDVNERLALARVVSRELGTLLVDRESLNPCEVFVIENDTVSLGELDAEADDRGHVVLLRAPA
jgi:hypothetical protein